MDVWCDHEIESMQLSVLEESFVIYRKTDRDREMGRQNLQAWMVDPGWSTDLA